MMQPEDIKSYENKISYCLLPNFKAAAQKYKFCCGTEQLPQKDEKSVN